MQLRRSNQRLARALALGLAAAAGLALAVPAQAQEKQDQATQSGSRYQVLVPNLEHGANVDDDFGKDVADALRKSIDKLPRHVSVSKNDLKDNLRKYKLKEEELDCIKSRQLAVQMNAELVMCGSYEPASGGMNVKASFVGARTGDTFEVPPFVAASPEAAATKIFNEFESYVNQLQFLAFCNEYLGSQQWQSALENCNKALQVTQTAAGNYGRARALMGMSPDSNVAAYAALQAALKINPTFTDALRAAGVLAGQLNKPEESLQYFNQYLELNPGDASVRVAIANEAAKAGNLLGAVKIVEQGLKNDSTASPDLLMYAGHWALQAAQKEEAAARDGAQKAPPLVDSLYTVALDYYQRLYAKADTATDPSVLRNMVILLNKRGQSQQAVEIGRKMVAAKPHDAGAWSVYADALSGVGQTDQALAALDTAAKYDTAQASPVYAKRAQILLEKDRLDEAKAALQQAIQRGTVKADDAAKLVFGVGYNEKFQKKDYDAALAYFAAVRDLAATPETKAMANFWTGYVYFQRGANLAQQNPKKPSKAAADLFRRAMGYFNDSDAYAAAQSGIRSQIEQMTSYANQYIKAVSAARGR